MDNENFNTSNVYSTFLSTNPSTIDSGTYLNTDDVIGGNHPNMLLSPGYGNKGLITLPPSCTTTQTHHHNLHPPFPIDISTILCTSQIAANFPQLQFPQETKSQLKQENFEERVVIPQAKDFPTTDCNNNNSNSNNNNIICPPTPTTPNNEILMLDGGWMNTQQNQINPEFIITQSMAVLNHAESLNQRGEYLLHNAKPRDLQTAFQCFFIAAGFGSQKGKHQVAYCLQHGFGVPKNEKKAVELYMEIANSGNPISASLCQLGICFQMGIGVQVDTTRAIGYYEHAVFMGNRDAMFNLAYCLRCGIGTPVNNERAYNIYLQLAYLGDPQGMKFVGNCKSIGIGTNQDKKEATEWFRCSSKSDIYWGGRVEYALDLLNVDDDGTSASAQNRRHEAFELLRSVCESFPTCPGPIKLLLGKCFHYNIGCRKDHLKALYWYQEAIKSYFMPLYAIQECQFLIGQLQYNQNISTQEPLIKKEVVYNNISDF